MIFFPERIKKILFQMILLGLLFFVLHWFVGNAIENLGRSHTSKGFGFLWERGGFDISQSLIHYSLDSTYFRALLVGFLNTLLVAVCGIFAATIIGFIFGIARLSKNWLINKIALLYVALFRNTPPLLVILFLYQGILNSLPFPRDSFILFPGLYLNNRGLYLPAPIWSEGAWLATALCFFLVGFVSWALIALKRKSGKNEEKKQSKITCSLVVTGIICVIAGGLWIVNPEFPMEFPKLGTFNISGGMNVKTEFMSLHLGLSLYTAAFITEIVRSAILGVAKGQKEAAQSLGLTKYTSLCLIIFPQAFRGMLPSLTNQYLNLTKNSSLAVAVGFADLYAVGGTILNQTGQAIEIVCIFMMVYLSLSLIISFLMNGLQIKEPLTAKIKED